MKLEFLNSSLEAIDDLIAYESLCCFIAEDERPLQGAAGLIDWRLDGWLSQLLLQKQFVGKLGEHLLFPNDGRLSPAKTFAVGVGRCDELTVDRLATLFEDAGQMIARALADSVAVALPTLNLSPSGVQQVFLDSFSMHFHGRAALFRPL